MSDPIVGRVETVPLREVWAHEAHSFTPWLAANLDLLAAELGLDSLDRVDEEVAVGAFSLDILATTNDGRRVIIENQIEPTDHTHLGQLLTYASGLDAALIVWVSSRVRDEHQSALTWLNENTNGNIHFFAVEVDAIRIGHSLPAPIFRVRVRPNDWEESARKAVYKRERTADLATWLDEVDDHRPDSRPSMERVAAHWESLGGRVGFGSSSMFLTVPIKSQGDPWPVAIYSQGKVEVVFQHLAIRSIFRDESMREALRIRINEIPGVTQLPPDSLLRRPGFDMSELEAPGALDAFLDVLTWFWDVVNAAAAEADA